MTIETDERVRPTAVPPPASASPGSLPEARCLNLPNLITVSRLVLAVILFGLIGMGGAALGLPVAALFLLAATTDAVDGYVARRYGQITTLGRVLDPFADKIIVCGTFVFLLERHPLSGVTAWMVVIVIGREMFVTGLRSFLEQQGKDFSATWSGKIKMILQCAALTASLMSLDPHIGTPGFLLFRDVLLWSAVVATVFSGLVYVVRAGRLLQWQQ